MKNKLQRYFPIIRTRKEILNELRDNDELWSQFEKLGRRESRRIS